MKQSICKECGDPRVINKHFCLCIKCNSQRLHKDKPKKIYQFKQSKPLKSKGYIKVNQKKTQAKIDKDEAFYELIFNSHPHICEECGCSLPDQFRDENGKVIARWQYSHVIPKSISPELRHDPKNINRLCLECHSEWENGCKEKMKIYKQNVKNFPRFF